MAELSDLPRIVRTDMAQDPAPDIAKPKAVDNDTPFNADETLVSVESSGKRFFMATVSVVALLIYASYLTYRAVFTINQDAIVFSLLVYFAELHGFLALFFYFHQLWHLRKRRPVPPPSGLKVDVYVTTYNEDVELLRQTLRAAVAMRYPHDTYVLDDGRRPEVRALADEVGCRYLTRPDNKHAKAGNWNNAFKQTSADFIATFDADHVPRADFLDRTLGFFRDPKVAIVQVPQRYHNLDSVQHRVNWKTRRVISEQDSFFNLVMPGKDNYNAAFFCGTGAVLRRKPLEPHGGILTDTITEDLHTSVVLHSEGWKSVYVNETLVTGLAPVDLKSFAIQRLRWSEGNLKAATYANPVTIAGLAPAQRISYVASLYAWTNGFPKLIFYMAPPWILFTGTFPIAHFDATFVSVYLAFITSLVVSYQIVSRGTGHLLMDELFNMVSFFTSLRAMKRTLFGRGKPGRFVVTSKRGDGTRDLAPVLPHLALLGFSALAVTWSLMGLGFGVTDDVQGAGTAIFWTLYNATLMVTVLRMSGRPADTRADCRFRANFAVEPRGTWAVAGKLGVTADVSERGCSLLWPDPIEVGRRIEIRVHFGPKPVDWIAEVVSDQGRQRDGWHRYGLHFPNLTTADMDVLSDVSFNLVVPDLLSTLTEPSWLPRQWRRLKLAWSRRTRARRQAVRVPMKVRYAGSSFVTTVRDVSATGLQMQSPMSLPLGARVRVTMIAPDRSWTADATVARAELRASAMGFDTWIMGLRFDREARTEDVEYFQRSDAA